MGFNAGGTNVGGVQSTEQGDLKIMNENIVFGGTGTKIETFTVPTGKNWILKAFSMNKVNTATVTGHEIRITTPDTKFFKLYQSGTEIVASTGVPQIFTLSPGTTVTYWYTVTADTDGEGSSKLIYQEVNEIL